MYPVELHGGTIEAASEGLGKGAIFTLRLPIPPEDPAPLPNCSTPMSPEGVLNKKRVLLAAAKDDTRDLIAVVLEHAGAVVVPAASIHAVLEELARSQPDLLIGAIALLRENNYELPQQLRLWSQEFGEAIPVVALATYSNELDPQEALTNGLQHVLLESMEPDGLVGAIAQLILSEP
jgi:CheY-like chemotaxis protein